MRLLVGFITVCVVVIAVVVWRIAAAVELPQLPSRDKRQTAASTSPAPRADAVPLRLTQPVASDLRVRRSSSGTPSSPDSEVRRYDGVAAAPPIVLRTPVAASRPAPASSPASTRPAVRWARGRQKQEALRRLTAARKALADDPYHPAALADELSALRELQRWPEAADTLARLIELEPGNVQRRLEYAETLLRLELWVSAIQTLEVLVEQAPDHARAWHYLAAAQQALGYLHDARQSWSRVLELTPQDAAAHTYRGQVLLDLHEWAAAAGDFEKALELDPENVDAALNLASALLRSGREGAAQGCVRDILVRHPRHVPAVNRLAEICWLAYRADPIGKRTELDATIEAYRRSLEIDPDQPSIRTLLEAALAENGTG